MYDFKIAAADTSTLYRDLASALESLVSGEPDPELLPEVSSEPPQAAVVAASAVTVSNAMSRVLSMVSQQPLRHRSRTGYFHWLELIGT